MYGDEFSHNLFLRNYSSPVYGFEDMRQFQKARK